MKNLAVNRLREMLAEGISRVQNAAPSGASHVILDRANALVIVDALATWGRDLSNARRVPSDFDLDLILNKEAEVVPFELARQVILKAMKAEFDHLTAKLSAES